MELDTYIDKNKATKRNIKIPQKQVLEKLHTEIQTKMKQKYGLGIYN